MNNPDLEEMQDSILEIGKSLETLEESINDIKKEFDYGVINNIKDELSSIDNNLSNIETRFNIIETELSDLNRTLSVIVLGDSFWVFIVRTLIFALLVGLSVSLFLKH